MKKYELEYQSGPLLTVEIADDNETKRTIKEMVEFWIGWKQMLDENGGDYTRAWLTDLARFCVLNGRIPNDIESDEGWCKLDGSCGIRVYGFCRIEFNDFELDIVEAKE